MALFRQIHVAFWDDPWIETLEPLQKYLYLYLMSNSRTRQCGIYEITEKKIGEDTGLSIDNIKEYLDLFERYDKLIYNRGTHEIIMLNWIKYNAPASPKIVVCVMKEMLSVKNKDFVRRYIELCNFYGYTLENQTYSIDTLFANEKGKPTKLKNTPPKDDTIKVPYQDIEKSYHSHCTSLPRIQVLSDKRKDQIRVVWKKFDDMKKKGGLEREIIDVFEFVFSKVQASDFLSGRDGKWSNCSFDWIMLLNNFIKIYEGQYDNKQPQTKTRGW
jgi:hypothetical protein